MTTHALPQTLRLSFASIWLALLSACGGGGGGGTPATYSITASVSGLSGAGLVLQNNGSGSVTVSGGATSVPIATGVNPGTSYAVTVQTQPAGQQCTVANGSGTVASANVTSISVTCASLYTVGGTLSGLNGTVVLQLNGSSNASLSANGSFSFATTLLNGAAYSVTVLTQPGTQTCTASSNSGSVAAANITNVLVTCVNRPTVSLTATPSLASLGSTAALSWSATGASSCTASGGWTGVRATTGSESSARVSGKPGTYTLVCTGPGGTANAAVTVSPICSTGAVPPGGTSVRGIKLWLSSNPPDLLNEYLNRPLNSNYELWHDVLLEARCAGANNITLQLSTGVMINPTDNGYSATEDLNPPEAALLGLANDARSLGLAVTLSFFSHVKNVITGSGGLDRPQPADRQAWFQNHRVRVLDTARLAKRLGASTIIFMQDETQHLVRDPALAPQWVQLIRDVRAEYSGTITTVWWTPGHGDSITAIPASIINELDHLGVGLFPNLVRAEEPDMQTLCRAFRRDADGFDSIAFLRDLSLRFNKRILITDKAFHSFKGASYDEWRVFDTSIPLTPDESLQARLFDSFFSVIYSEGAGWLEGVAVQNFNNLIDGANSWIARFVDGPVSESPQHKLAEGVISDWYGGRRTSGC